MAGSSNYRVNIVTDVEDLIITNRELKATSRYIEQIQRLSDRLGRARYQSLIKLNTELKYMHRHLGNIYSLAIRLSRLRIIPKVFLIDKATPVLEALIRKLKSLKDAYIVARAKTGIDQDGIRKGKGGNEGNNSNVSNIVNKSINVTTNLNINDPKFDFNFNFNNDFKIGPPRIVFRVAAPKFAPRINVKTGPIRVSPKINVKTGPIRVFTRIKVICDCCCGKKGNGNRGTVDPNGPDGKDKNKNKNNGKPGRKRWIPGIWESLKRFFNPKPGNPGSPEGRPNGNKGMFGKIFDFGKKLLGGNLGNTLAKLGKGAAKAGKRVLGPLSLVLDIADIANASPEDRPAAITSASLVGGFAAAGGAIGTMIAPGIGTLIGGLIGGLVGAITDILAGEWLTQKFTEMINWVGEKIPAVMDWVGEKTAIAKEWIGEKTTVAEEWIGEKTTAAKEWIGEKATVAKEWLGEKAADAKEWVGEKASQAAGWMSDKATEVSTWFSSQADSLKNKLSDILGYSKGPEKSQPEVSVNNVSQPYNPAITPGASLVLSEFSSGLPTPPVIRELQSRSETIQGMGSAGSQSSMTNGGKTAPYLVQITDEQMSSLSGFLKDFKTETNNQVSVTLPPGAVQVTVREDSIDFDAMALQVGYRIVNEVRQAMINRKGGGDNSSPKKGKAVLV